jgi:hypothetical protein
MKKQPREAAFSSGAGKTVEPFYENKYFTNTNGFNAIWVEFQRENSLRSL